MTLPEQMTTLARAETHWFQGNWWSRLYAYSMWIGALCFPTWMEFFSGAKPPHDPERVALLLVYVLAHHSFGGVLAIVRLVGSLRELRRGKVPLAPLEGAVFYYLLGATPFLGEAMLLYHLIANGVIKVHGWWFRSLAEAARQHEERLRIERCAEADRLLLQGPTSRGGLRVAEDVGGLRVHEPRDGQEAAKR